MQIHVVGLLLILWISESVYGAVTRNVAASPITDSSINDNNLDSRNFEILNRDKREENKETDGKDENLPDITDEAASSTESNNIAVLSPNKHDVEMPQDTSDITSESNDDTDKSYNEGSSTTRLVPIKPMEVTTKTIPNIPMKIGIGELDIMGKLSCIIKKWLLCLKAKMMTPICCFISKFVCLIKSLIKLPFCYMKTIFCKIICFVKKTLKNLVSPFTEHIKR